jgi:hypothetical protein
MNMIKVNRDSLTTMTVSVLLHVAILFALSFLVFEGPMAQLQMVLDTVFDAEERAPEEFAKDVEESTVATESVNFVTGATAVGMSAGASSGGGNGGVAVAQQRIEQAESLRVAEVRVNMGAMNVPGFNVIGKDLDRRNRSSCGGIRSCAGADHSGTRAPDAGIPGPRGLAVR